MEHKKYTCKFCLREYTRKTYFDRHILVCEIISKKSIEKEEESDTPNIRKLYEIILELTKKNNELEKKVNHLSKWLDVKKKKINVIEWLDTHIIPNITYSQFVKKLYEMVDREQLEKIFEHGHILGVTRIIYCLIDKSSEENIPIKAFDQKENCLYIYEYDEQLEKNKWTIMSQIKFNRFISDISKLIMREFNAWKDENEHRLAHDDFAIQYHTNLLKVIGGQMSIEHVNTRLKHNLYKHIKMNIKNIVDYEFTF
jgi:hypothetical protein